MRPCEVQGGRLFRHGARKPPSFANNGYFPEDIRGKGAWNNYANYGNPIGYLKTVYDRVVGNKVDWIGNHLCYPVIICQQVAK